MRLNTQNRKHAYCRLVLIAVLSLLLPGLFFGCRRGEKEVLSSVVTGRATITGDESLSPLVDAQIVVFQGLYSNATIERRYLPENEAVNQLLEEKVRLGIITRPLNARETGFFAAKNIFPECIPIARDAVALIVHPDNPVSALTIDQIRDILSGKAMQWKDVSEDDFDGKADREMGIRQVFDSQFSGVIRYLNDSLHLNGKIAGDIIFAGSSRKQIDIVGNDPMAIGFIGYNQISEKENTEVKMLLLGLKIIAVSASTTADTTNSFVPSVATLYNGLYPLIRTVYAVYTDPAAGLPKGFLSHLTSERGQKIVYRMGLKPENDFQRAVQIKEGL